MHFQHEGEKMNPALLFDMRAGKEDIHQHGFAPPNAAENVEALGFRQGKLGEAQALAPAAAAVGARTLCGRARERVVQRLEFLGGQQLGRIGFQHARGAAPAVCHERPLA